VLPAPTSVVAPPGADDVEPPEEPLLELFELEPHAAIPIVATIVTATALMRLLT
jgi:hypothetical protein